MSERTSSMTIYILAEGLLTVIVSRLDSSHELDLNQYFRATCLLVDREWSVVLLIIVLLKSIAFQKWWPSPIPIVVRKRDSFLF